MGTLSPFRISSATVAFTCGTRAARAAHPTGRQPDTWSSPRRQTPNWGTADQVIPPESGQLYVQRIPNSYRILIDGAAHVLPISACRKFVELVTDFIEHGERFVVAEAT